VVRWSRVHRTLIVARMNPEDAPAVAGIFAESDAGELPRLVGVTGRRLYRFHDVYIHVVDTAGDVRPGLAQVRTNPLFVDVNEKLAGHITAYDPATWRGPQDAMATEFYSWSA